MTGQRIFDLKVEAWMQITWRHEKHKWQLFYLLKAQYFCVLYYGSGEKKLLVGTCLVCRAQREDL